MKSIEKLREKIRLDVNNPWSDLKGDLLAMCDRIEAEIAERYMELPLDADGVPIRVGDTVEYPNGNRDVVRFITVNDNEPTFNEMGWIASKCHHVKPRTLEDVLDEMADEIIRQGHQAGLTAPDIIAKYADEIRSMGVGE